MLVRETHPSSSPEMDPDVYFTQASSTGLVPSCCFYYQVCDVTRPAWQKERLVAPVKLLPYTQACCLPEQEERPLLHCCKDKRDRLGEIKARMDPILSAAQSGVSSSLLQGFFSVS